MPKPTPTPRSANYLGMKTQAHTAKDGTWLEPEELCYPSGRELRKAYAKCEDGELRVITCGIPDTFFSIPGFYKKDGKRVRGFVSVDTSTDDGGYKFTVVQKQEGK